MMDFDKIFRDGQIPDTLEEKTILLKRIAVVERRGSVVSALNLAAAYESDFGGDGPRWLDWARNDVGLDKTELYHRLAVGRMLLAVRGRAVLYRKLVGMTVDRLLPLTRIFRLGGADAVIGFASQRPGIFDMDRDAIRDAVTECICIMEGRPVPEKRDRTPNLPGWESLLDGQDDAGDGIRAAVTTAHRAHRAAELGDSLLTEWLEFESAHPGEDGLSRLEAMREALAEKIATIEKLMRDTNNASSDKHSAGTVQTEEHTTGKQCGNNTEFAQTGHHNTGKRCGNNTGEQCGNNTEFVQTERHNTGKQCGNNTDEPYDFDAVFGYGSGAYAGIGAPHGGGTPAVPGEGRGDQARGTASDGSAGCDPGGDPVGVELSDPVDERPEGREPADLSELQELEAADQGTPGGQAPGGPGRPV